jgi:hypothetical protein
MEINISYKIVDYLLFYAPNFSTKDHLFLKDVKFYYFLHLYKMVLLFN